MADDFGRVTPVIRDYLNRGVREEPYPGRRTKKHPSQPEEPSEMEDAQEEIAGDPKPGNHIDLRA